jgi:hypothetical protein
MVFGFPNRKFKGVWWMPWLEIAMKDVAWRRYASGRCLATFDPEISEWGNPSYLYEIPTQVGKRTLGSKTFQYQEENRLISIP